MIVHHHSLPGLQAIGYTGLGSKYLGRISESLVMDLTGGQFATENWIIHNAQNLLLHDRLPQFISKMDIEKQMVLAPILTDNIVV
jgi:hypothetical protein